MPTDPTPGRPRGRSGVLFVLVLVMFPACDRIVPGATLQLDSTEVTLGPGVEIHDVRIDGAGAEDSVNPSTVDAATGDVVRFEVGDHRTHALAFRAESLSAEAREFLERTGQLRGPPLVNEGAAWVVSLDGAPAGRYPFICRSHDATGVLVVRSDD